MVKKIVITGGAGFIGSHLVEAMIRKYSQTEICILDKLTYAADIRNLDYSLSYKKVQLIPGDICNFDTCKQITEDCDLLIHVAAESHVDNSFSNSLNFTKTNTVGTHSLMEACRINNVNKIIHLSTDEVYGEIFNGKVNEEAKLNPTNLYAASKASADLIVQSYFIIYRLPVIIIRANNIYGTRQFPEKIIPKFINHLLFEIPLPLHGNGKNVRSYLSVEDLISALYLLIDEGKIGEIYNVGTSDEYANIQIAEMLCSYFGVSPQAYIKYVLDRPFNDSRYSLSIDKITEMGWKKKYKLTDKIPQIIEWYQQNINRYSHLFLRKEESILV